MIVWPLTRSSPIVSEQEDGRDHVRAPAPTLSGVSTMRTTSTTIWNRKQPSPGPRSESSGSPLYWTGPGLIAPVGRCGPGLDGWFGHEPERYGTRPPGAAAALLPSDDGPPTGHRPPVRGVALRLAPRARADRRRRRGDLPRGARGARPGGLGSRPRLPLRRGAAPVGRARRPTYAELRRTFYARRPGRVRATVPARRRRTRRRRPRSSPSSATGSPRTASTPGTRARSATSRRRRCRCRSSASCSPSSPTRASTSGTPGRSGRSSRRRSGAGCATSSATGRTSFGILTSGGVMANLMAMTVARDVHLRRLLGLDRPPRGRELEGVRVYASEQTHFSIARALDELGFPPETLHLVPADERFRLRGAPVAEAIAGRPGRRPQAVGDLGRGRLDEHGLGRPDRGARRRRRARGPVAPRRRGLRRRGAPVGARPSAAARPRPGRQHHDRPAQVVLPGLRHRRAARPPRRRPARRLPPQPRVLPRRRDDRRRAAGSRATTRPTSSTSTSARSRGRGAGGRSSCG